MHLKTQITLSGNYPLEVLQAALMESITLPNQIDVVLREMVSISADLEDGIRQFSICGIKTGNFYYLFTQDNLSIICQIEIHSDDNILNFQLEHVFSFLDTIQQKLKNRAFSTSKFLPLRLFDFRGYYSGILISKTTNKQALVKGFLNPKFFEILSISATFFVFRIFKSTDVLIEIMVSFLVGLLVYFVQVAQTFIDKRNKISYNGGSNE